MSRPGEIAASERRVDNATILAAIRTMVDELWSLVDEMGIDPTRERRRRALAPRGGADLQR